MKIAILGFGRQGQSAYNYYKDKAQITICDQNPDVNLPSGVESRLGPGYLEGLDDFDLLLRTPYLPPRAIVEANGPDILNKVTSATNEFLEIIKTPVIGVTGTKGKGTTCHLITSFLQAAGYKVALGGNIGISPLDMLKEAQESDFVVLELANFQCLDLKVSPSVAVCLEVSPEHLNWHSSYEEYVQAKIRLFANQKQADRAVVCLDSPDSKRCLDATLGQKVTYSQKEKADFYAKDGQVFYHNKSLFETEAIALRGDHSLINVLAATAACYPFLKDAPPNLTQGLASCHNLRFRLQTIAQINDVEYINDSYSSHPAAAVAALRAVKKPVVMILGGASKNSDLEPIVSELLKSKVIHLFLLGEAGQQIKQLLAKRSFSFEITDSLTTMPEIVTQAAKLASPGSAVLLSPGSASFGLFKNYDDRGEKFSQAVAELSGGDQSSSQLVE